MLEKGKLADLQDIFNCAWEQAKKKQKSTLPSDRNTCAYRGRDGAKCFVGAAIKDEDYDEKFERLPSTYVIKEITEVKTPNHVIQLIRDLQSIHDDVDIEFWEDELRTFAIDNNLTIPGEEQ